jgi:hypothetical protein
MQDEHCPGPGVFQVYQEVPGLLHYPRLNCAVAPTIQMRRVPCSVAAGT